MTPPTRPNRAAEIAAKAARLAGGSSAVSNSSSTQVSIGVNEDVPADRQERTVPAVLSKESVTDPVINPSTEPAGTSHTRNPHAAVARRPATPRTRAVRLSVDIPPNDHAALVQASVTLAAEIGVTRVHHREILHALLQLMLDDPQLHERVRDQIERQRRLLP